MRLVSHRPLTWITALIATCLTLAAIAVGAAPPAALADEGADQPGHRTWALVPATADGPDGRGRFNYIVEPGFDYTDHLAVRNFSNEPLTLSLDVRAAEQTLDDAFTLRTDEGAEAPVSSWLDLERREITVEPRSDALVPFTLRVPTDAEPGDHAGGIIAILEPPQGEAGVSMQVAVGARVYVRVAGPAEPGVRIEGLGGSYAQPWTPFGHGSIDARATLVNTGNVRVTPRVEVEAVGLFGLWHVSHTVEELPELLRDGATSLSSHLRSVPQIGPVWVTAQLVGLDSQGQDLTGVVAHDSPSATIVVWAMPWTLLIAAALLLTAGIIAIRNLRARLKTRPATDR